MCCQSFRVLVRMTFLSLCLLPPSGLCSSTSQTIFFSPLSPSTTWLTALATSGLPVHFESTTPGVCVASSVPEFFVPPSLSPWALTLVGLGTCSITATQDGDSTYSPATPVTRTLSIPAPLPQVIQFPPLQDMVLERLRSAGLAASATSGLEVSFVSQTPQVCWAFIYADGSAHIRLWTVQFLSPGVCTITASQAGNAAWTAAPSVTQSFTITAPARMPQDITLPTKTPDVTFGQTATVALNAIATSGLPVSFASNSPAVCSVSGATAAIVGVGACNITASQPGDATYAPASYSLSFKVNPAHPADVTVNSLMSTTRGTQFSPGSLFSIFGNFMASGTLTATPPLPLSLNGTVVTFNGTPCPLLYISPTQINAQVPAEAALGLATVAVSYNGTSSSATMQVLPASPGFFSNSVGPLPGIGFVPLAIAQHADYSPVTAANPARAGEIVIFYGTGIGPVSPAVASGQPAPDTPNLAVTTGTYSATVNGIDAPVSFLGLTPGLVGVMQLNLQIPNEIPSGFFYMHLIINGLNLYTGVGVPLAGQ